MIITTTGHPRCGNTWLGKLLSDVLGGRWQPDINKPPYRVYPQNAMNPRWVRPNIVVRKTHSNDLAIIDDGPVVFIYRDPRDVVVSRWFYNRRSFPLKDAVSHIVDVSDPSRDLYGGYERFIRTWMDEADVIITYESMISNPVKSLNYMVEKLGQHKTPWRERIGEDWDRHVAASVQRQSFDVVKSSDPKYFAHSMRKGIAGDWKNHFTPAVAEFITDKLGHVMLELGYINNLDWWRDYYGIEKEEDSHEEPAD